MINGCLDLESVFKPRENLTVTEWAEKNLYFSPRFTARSGDFRCSYTPYLRDIIDLWKDHSIQEVAVCTSAQWGKTTLQMVLAGYAIDQDPGPALFVMPNEKLCRSFNEQRFQPLINDCETLAAHKPKNKKKFRLDEIYFDRMQFAFAGSNSPANLSSRPVRYLFLDETDKYAEASKKEAGAIELAAKRTRTFWNSKILYTSTPTTKEGAIWRLFCEGDQRYYQMPCIHCDHLQKIQFKQLRFDDAKVDGEWDLGKLKDVTFYECELCNGQIYDKHKRKMLDRGVWVADAISDKPSFHGNALYPIWTKFHEVARAFLESYRWPDKLQDFTNSTLGEIYEESSADKMTMEHLLSHVHKEYKLGDCPQKPHSVVMTVDVQKDHFYYVIRGWCEYGTSYLIERGTVPSYQALVDIRNRPLKFEFGQCMIGGAFIDAGDGTRSTEIYDFCRRSGFYPIIGFGDEQNNPVPGYFREINQSKITAYFVNNSMNMWTLTRTITKPPHGVGTWWLPADIDDIFLKQMLGKEPFEEIDKYGGIKIRWKKVDEDHYQDCEKYQIAIATTYGFRETTTANQEKNKMITESVTRPDGRGFNDIGGS